MVILEVVKSLNDKSATVVFFFKLKRKQKRGEERGKLVAISFERFLIREREHFSLDLYVIQPSAVFGTRRRTDLREEGFAWVPDL